MGALSGGCVKVVISPIGGMKEGRKKKGREGGERRTEGERG